LFSFVFFLGLAKENKTAGSQCWVLLGVQKKSNNGALIGFSIFVWVSYVYL
jgi:hypothetical protein